VVTEAKKLVTEVAVNIFFSSSIIISSTLNSPPTGGNILIILLLNSAKGSDIFICKLLKSVLLIFTNTDPNSGAININRAAKNEKSIKREINADRALGRCSFLNLSLSSLSIIGLPISERTADMIM